MKAKLIGAVVVVFLAGWLAGTARANFELYGVEQKTVDTAHLLGVLHNQSQADVVTGGSVTDGIWAYDTSTVNISGGTVNQVYAYDSSTVDMSAYWVNHLDAFDTSTVDISGGSVGDVMTYDSSTVNISGGSVQEDVYVVNTSTATISGGSVDEVWTAHTGTVHITGGQVRIAGVNGGVVNVSGGSIGGLTAYGSVLVNVSGGSIGSMYGLKAYDSALVTFNAPVFHLGPGLSLDGERVLGTGILGGVWFDGTPWAVPISQNAAGATILAIPEPATLSLLAVGGLAMLRRRRRSHPV